MLNKAQYLLNLLQEESVEVAQRASKCIRFTCEHKYAEYRKSNIGLLQEELTDFLSILHLLELELGIKFDMSVSRAKIDRVINTMRVSRDLGVLG